MKMHVKAGTVDFTVLVLIRDTDGAPATALTEASIDIAYARVETDNDVTTTDVTPAALAALTTAHTDWGFEEVSATDHPGLYRLDIADAVFATGAWSAVVSIVGTGLDPCQIEFVLVGYDQHDGVRLGLTALPNAAADAAGGLPISDAGGLDLDAQIGTDINTLITEVAKVPKSDSNVTWNATALASINTQADTALSDYDPPTKAELDAAVANVSVDEIQATALADLFNTDSGTTYASAVAGSVVAEIADNAGGSALTADAIADAVWDEATAGHTTSGTFGEQLKTEVDGIQADTEDIQSRLPAALVNSRMDCTIDGTGMEAGAVTAVQSGLATSAALTTVDTVVDAIKAVTDLLPDAGALTSVATAANLTTVDTVVDAIKVQTDKLTFTVANVLDSNVTHVNDTEVTGDGGTGTEWGPA